VRGERRHDVKVYEIGSEFLLPSISKKKQEHEAKARLARETRRLRLYYAASVVLIVATAVAAGVISYKQYDAVRDARRDAELLRARLQKQEADRQAIQQIVGLLNSDSEDDRKRGIEQLDGFHKANGTIPPEVGFALLGAMRRQLSAVPDSTSELLAQATADDPSLARLVDEAARYDSNFVDRLPPRINVMYPTGAQRERAISLKRQIARKGFVVPAIGQVNYDDAPGQPQLRYFLDEDEGKAKEAAAALSGIRIGNVGAAKIRTSKAMQPGQFELWLAAEDVPAGAQWFIRIRFAETEARKETLASTANVLVSYYGGQLSFPERGLAELGPYDYEKARRVRDILRGDLSGTDLGRSSAILSPR
jgi:hypothetical protein